MRQNVKIGVQLLVFAHPDVVTPVACFTARPLLALADTGVRFWGQQPRKQPLQEASHTHSSKFSLYSL